MPDQPTPSPAPGTGPPGAQPARQLTCFVVIGFGRKTDYATGRVLDLDKTYEQLIRPAFDRVNVNCFRAIDANLTGSIDKIMYQWLYAADFVVADLSTLNANVFYELGVRHAQKPNTTIIIAEQVLMQKVPFDLSSFVIHSYAHAGESIPAEEQARFVDHLAGIVQKIIDRAKQVDSPVYTFMEGMTPPGFVWQTALVPPAYVPPDQRRKAAPGGETRTLATLVEGAEAAKNRKDYAEAIRLFTQAIGQQKKPDLFLAQRLALVTYKHGERKGPDGKMDPEVAKTALLDAQDILAKYCAPRLSTDPETLGLSGAISKRLFEVTGEVEYLDQALGYYERGFYVKQDYYNGINAAFLYTLRANLLKPPYDAIVSYGHANILRQKVAALCEELMGDEAAFQARDDREWVYATLAEAYVGMGKEKEAAKFEDRLKRVAGQLGREFAVDSYLTQKDKLNKAMREFVGRSLG